jgi:hypothetical protein
VARGPGGRFLKGTRVTGGSRRGKPNRSTVAGREAMRLLLGGGGNLPSASERWKRLLLDPSADIRLKAEVFVWAVVYGRPRIDEGPEVDEKPFRPTFESADLVVLIGKILGAGGGRG